MFMLVIVQKMGVAFLSFTAFSNWSSLSLMLDTVTLVFPVYMHSVYGLWGDPPFIFCVISGIPVSRYTCVGVLLRYGGGIL